MKFFTVAGFVLLAAPLWGTSISYVTVDTSIFSGGVSNIYDSVSGLSQHIGTCFIPPTTNVGPCAAESSTPATNTLGLTAASVAISNGVSFDPNNGVTGFANASAYADLGSGKVGVLANGLPCSPVTPLCADSGNAIGEIQDGLAFINTTGSVQNITMSWSFDGTFTSNSTGTPSETFTSLFCFTQGANCFGNPGALPHGPLSTSLFQLQDSNGTVTNTSPSTGWVSTSVIAGANAASEIFQGVFAVPTGTSSESLNAYLIVGCLMATCDFSHTGALNIGPLPAGVSFTSTSGVLLTSAAPEPGSWLLGITGVLGCVIFARAGLYTARARP